MESKARRSDGTAHIHYQGRGSGGPRGSWGPQTVWDVKGRRQVRDAKGRRHGMVHRVWASLSQTQRREAAQLSVSERQATRRDGTGRKSKRWTDGAGLEGGTATETEAWTAAAAGARGGEERGAGGKETGSRRLEEPPESVAHGVACMGWAAAGLERQEAASGRRGPAPQIGRAPGWRRGQSWGSARLAAAMEQL